MSMEPVEPEKILQKKIPKRIVDPAGPYVQLLQNRFSLQAHHTSPWIQPTMAASMQMLPPPAFCGQPTSSICRKLAASKANHTRCAVNCATWTNTGNWCMTGDNVGHIMRWNRMIGLGNDFECNQPLGIHAKAVRNITFSRNGRWMLSCDDAGTIWVYNNKLLPFTQVAAHQQSCRAVDFAPYDERFASCSDDHTIKIWQFSPSGVVEDRTFTGHGSDVKHVTWHPSSSLLASGGRDGAVMLWDAREKPGSAEVTAVHGHKQTVNQVKWNSSGSWLASCSRDQSIRVWDIRQMKQELHVWRGHTRDVLCLAWHPVHLELMASGGNDGSIMHWMVGQSQHADKLERAHDGGILEVAFHPFGHVMASCSYDASVKFWVRPRPGEAEYKLQDGASAAYADLLAANVSDQAAAGRQPRGIPGRGVPGAHPPGITPPRSSTPPPLAAAAAPGIPCVGLAPGVGPTAVPAAGGPVMPIMPAMGLAGHAADAALHSSLPGLQPQLAGGIPGIAGPGLHTAFGHGALQHLRTQKRPRDAGLSGSTGLTAVDQFNAGRRSSTTAGRGLQGVGGSVRGRGRGLRGRGSFDSPGRHHHLAPATRFGSTPGHFDHGPTANRYPHAAAPATSSQHSHAMHLGSVAHGRGGDLAGVEHHTARGSGRHGRGFGRGFGRQGASAANARPHAAGQLGRGPGATRGGRAATDPRRGRGQGH